MLCKLSKLMLISPGRLYPYKPRALRALKIGKLTLQVLCIDVCERTVFKTVSCITHGGVLIIKGYIVSHNLW